MMDYEDNEECEDENKIKIFSDKLDSIKNNYFLSRYIKIFKDDIIEVFEDNIKIKQIKGEIDSPDIILINIENPINIKQEIHHDINFQFNDNYNEINYNGNSYKLDYIIHGSNDKYTCINCGHVICGIHYENQEYYYDSRYKVDKLKCDSEKVNLPCPLLKSTWSDKITNDDYCYKLEKCGHIEWNEKNFNPIEKDNSKV
jgi:hypothetical protein